MFLLGAVALGVAMGRHSRRFRPRPDGDSRLLPRLSWLGREWAASAGSRPSEHLERYARVFNTVEGNTTFYALPLVDGRAVARPGAGRLPVLLQVPARGQHDKLLVECEREVDDPSNASCRWAASSARWSCSCRRGSTARTCRDSRVLEMLPRELHYAVELRHDAFFADTTAARGAVELLREHGVDFVILDTRGVHAGHSLMMAEVRARKPVLPVIVRTTAAQPIVRCVPHETFDDERELVESWAPELRALDRRRQRPYSFMHAPDEMLAPSNAYAFHACCASRRRRRAATVAGRTASAGAVVSEAFLRAFLAAHTREGPAEWCFPRPEVKYARSGRFVTETGCT